MSAIFGIVRTDGAPVPAATLTRMGNTLAHRGPDGRRLHAEGAVGLGHCLARAVVEDWHDIGPLRDGALAVTADIRLDNREELAAALDISDAALAAMADVAVLLAAWRRWGEGCVDRLLGDFAFAVHDGETLWLVRDPMGQRGVYCHHGDGMFAFASEPRALWAVEGVPRRLSEVGIGRRLLFPIDPSDGSTLYEGIRSLGGGTIARLGADGPLTIRRYWQPRAGPEHLGHDDAYYLAAYRAVLGEAVACRIRRTIRAPALLFSGGFDSGAIAGLAAPTLAAQDRRMLALCSALARGEERVVRSARDAAQAFADRPHLDLRYFVRTTETPFDDLEGKFAAIGQPVPGAIVRGALYRMAAQAGSRVVLDGMGGDYTLNVRAGAMLGRMLLRGRVAGFARELAARRRLLRRPWWQLWREDVLPALMPLRLSAAIQLLRRRGVPLWRTRTANPDFARAMFESGAIDPARLRSPRSIHDRWQARWVNMLTRAAADEPVQHILAAAHGTDFTRPFHDRRVVELALAIPERLQFRGGNERWLARHALADLLPARLLASGPGNDAEDPDMYRAVADGAPAALARARQLDAGGRLSRYVDLDRVEAMIATASADERAGHRAMHVAARAIALARFIAWFDDRNR